MKSAAKMSKKDDKKLSLFKIIFGGIREQKRVETTTMGDGTKVKKTVETQIPFDASEKVQTKEELNCHDTWLSTLWYVVCERK